MRFVTVPLLLIALSFSSVFASPQFNRCKAVLRSLSQPTQDSSVELEIRNSDPVLELLTTTDGTLAPLLPPKSQVLPNGYALIPELERSFKGWSYEQLAQEPWDNLTQEQKRHFLTWITLRKPTDFFIDRKMPGIKIKDKASVTFTVPTEFLGKTYEAGTHEIDISHLFRHVEYGDPSQSPDRLELHFRSKNPAGDVSNGAWTFLAGIKTNRIHQHVHIVSPLNIERLKKEGTVRSAMLADFYRRANLTLEMIHIIEEKKTGIKGRQNGNVILWDTLTPNKLKMVFRHLEHTRTMGQQPNFGSASKMAFVGFRGADTYDADNLIGFEVRAISHYSNEKLVKEFLNTLQWSLAQEHHGIPQEKMAQWLEQQPRGWSFNFGNSYYNQPWESLKNTEAGKKFESIDSYLRTRFYDLENNRELKMILYDWSNDPLLFDKPKLQALIKKEQLKAVDRLAAGNEPQQKIVSEFLIHSGIYGIFTRSLGY